MNMAKRYMKMALWFYCLFFGEIARVFAAVEWGIWWRVNAKNQRFRILQMMRGVVMDNQQRVNDLQPYRSMYEESPHFEIGYVFGEIIERYRKIVEINRKVQAIRVDYINTVYFSEHSQNIYLELYHLGNMLHEIIPKYSHDEEFQDLKDELWYMEMMDKTQFEPGAKRPQRVDRRKAEIDRLKRLLNIYKERKRKMREIKDKIRQQKEMYGGFNIKELNNDGAGGVYKYFEVTTSKNDPILVQFKYHYKADGSVDKYRFFHGNASFEKLPAPGFSGWYLYPKKPGAKPGHKLPELDYGWEPA